MESAITIILGTVAIYLALFIHMAFSPKISNKILTVAAAFSVLCGLVFYGICFLPSVRTRSWPLRKPVPLCANCSLARVLRRRSRTLPCCSMMQ